MFLCLNFFSLQFSSKTLIAILMTLSYCSETTTQRTSLFSRVRSRFSSNSNSPTPNEISTTFAAQSQLCARNCTAYPEPRTCYYKFIVEQYHTMGPACGNCGESNEDCFRPQCVIGDGIERTVMTINRKIPGPAIQVCLGDRIIIDITNKIPAKSLTFHWHGMLQELTPYMDGVAYVTQCPINEGATFQYDFRATTDGTHFYHSHLGFYMLDGLSGALIVRRSRQEDPVSQHYDYDMFSHTIHITEWMHVLTDDKYPGFNKNESMITLKGDSYLINGMGSYTDPGSGTSTRTPWARFTIEANKRHRFRILGLTSLDCHMRITFEGHGMTVIATDGYPVKAVTVRTLYITSGESYDVVINANQTPGTYWIRVQGVQECEPAVQYAILQYKGNENAVPATPNTAGLFTSLSYPDLNNFSKECDDPSINLCTDMLRSVHPVPDTLLRPNPNKRFRYYLSIHQFTNEELYNPRSYTYYRHYLPISGPDVTPLGGMFTDTINNKSNVFPPYPIYMKPFPDDQTCPAQCNGFCECLNLENIEIGDVVEITIIDDLSDERFQVAHPMHLHGYNFRVFKVATAKERKERNINESIKYDRNFVKKDTVAVPPGGYATLRFLANNPGLWVFHCHIVFHHHNGMLVTFQVGQRTAFRRAPADWPTCGDYVPVGRS